MHKLTKTAVLLSIALISISFTITANAAKPIKIGVIAPASAIDGKSILQAAEMATDQINANGGIDGRKIALNKFDDHASASDGVRAFQRAAKQDHDVAVIGNFISEVTTVR